MFLSAEHKGVFKKRPVGETWRNCYTEECTLPSSLCAGHDASIRLWDVETRTCVQEFTSHRRKHDESIHSVAFHPTLPLIASAGADGLVKNESKGDSRGLLMVCCLGSASLFAGVFWSMRSIKKEAAESRLPVKQNGAKSLISPSRLALRALLAGTVLSFAITGGLAGGVWLILGRPSLQSLSSELDSRIPKLKPLSTEETSRTDFMSFRELFTYIQDEGGANKVE
ncbi:unnamed protein product [Hydatigera taeniaeformis]|uniref:Transmembrane protein 242 n=1 Tax=Hydatigena taeniaeformis TaxID=6205 RepID=A0A0R3WVA6_HYDTA|nr:unnamed protein product [Hydatigera taeniaeformis]